MLRQYGCEVKVVMTNSATQFVRPLTFQALSGNKVATKLLDPDTENVMEHINFARWADVIVIAPASANMLAKFSHGLADDLLSTLYLAASCPIYIAPAMNSFMWHNPATQTNIQRLKTYGVQVIDPELGEQACGEIGLGRMSEAINIYNILIKSFTNNLVLAGKKVLISAGPTQEPLDPVRYISNRSSGKMGYAIAEAILNAGAQVTLVSGQVALSAPKNITLIKVETAEQMHRAILSRANKNNIYIGVAAVADYKPANISPIKIKKRTKYTEIKLQKTQDIIAEVAALPDKPFVVGFAAETNNLKQNAKNKLAKKNLDMIVANLVGQKLGGFEDDKNALQVYWHNGEKTLKMATKTQLAEQLTFLLAKIINAKNTT